MAVNLSPAFNDTQFKSDGTLASSYKIYTYAEGSSTALATYTTSLGTVPQANPVVLNSRGEVDNLIWLTAGLGYKLVLTDANGVVIRTEDNIRGVNDATVSVDQWVSSGLTPTYVSSTQFTLAGDQTSAFHVGRRGKFTVTAGTVYARFSASAYGALTTVTVDSAVLDAGLSAVSLGLLTTDNPSSPALKDSDFRVLGSADKTKRLAFEVDGITTATTRTMTVPDVDGTIALAGTEYFTSNLTLTATVATNALTIAIKTKAGTDPTTGNPAYVGFRNATSATGDYTVLPITAATSLVVSSGSTLGTTNATLARLWVIGINDAGTFRLGVVNLSTYLSIGDDVLISSTAEGGAGAADSAGVIYTGTAVASKAMKLLGYVEATQATAGTWVTSPSKIQLYNQAYSVTPIQLQIQSATLQATTSGTSVDFTGIPTWVKRVTLMLNGVSTNGTTNLRVRIGPVAGVETSGYLGSSTGFAAATMATQNFTAGIDMNDGSIATSVRHGAIVFTLIDSATNTWAYQGTFGQSDTTRGFTAAGIKPLAGALSIIRLTSVGGADTFDAGSANIMYE